MPELGVYFVKPASSDAIAAALVCSGVSKSGSPAPKLQTSIPSDFIALALLSIERVRDGVKLVALEESCIKDSFQDYMALPVFSTKDFQRSFSPFLAKSVTHFPRMRMRSICPFICPMTSTTAS